MAVGARAYAGSLEFFDLIENGIRKWCNIRETGDLCCLLYQKSHNMISYSMVRKLSVA